MKALLIRPKPDKETIGLQHVMICEPLELEYLVSNVPEDLADEVTVKIYDFILEVFNANFMLFIEIPFKSIDMKFSHTSNDGLLQLS